MAVFVEFIAGVVQSDRMDALFILAS